MSCPCHDHSDSVTVDEAARLLAAGSTLHAFSLGIGPPGRSFMVMLISGFTMSRSEVLALLASYPARRASSEQHSFGYGLFVHTGDARGNVFLQTHADAFTPSGREGSGEDTPDSAPAAHGHPRPAI